MFNSNDLLFSATKLSREIADKTQSKILEQLNDFISRGLIVVELGEPSFVRNFDSSAMEFKQIVNLVLKDKEYIVKLEEENQKYKVLLKELTAISKE